MVIEIPNEVMKQLKMSPQQLKLELAVYLYSQHKLSIGQAKALAGLDLISFQKELAERGVYLHFNESDLEEDLENLDLIV
ncbi:MAG: hypothetical protein CMN32_08600 [Saprospirales bacterium]|mgnify:CR=1 FL=1|nr:hypothetical protein [Saprospirales bacterium]